mgnify:CR=1 FL=1
MAFTRGNFWQAVQKARKKAWLGEDVTYVQKGPDLINNESLSAINAAGTGEVELIKADGSNVTQLPNGANIPTGKTFTQTDAGAMRLNRPRITTSIDDVNGNEVIKTPATTSAVNEVTITNAATGGVPTISATGDDTSIPIQVSGKGTGAVYLGQVNCQGVALNGDQPILDSVNNELIKFTKATDAVNEVTIANAATATSPLLSATGGDTNISLRLAAKGTGQIVSANRVVQLMAAATDATAAAISYTAAQLLGGLILRDPNGLARADLLPTAALLVAAIPGSAVGTAFEFTLRNTADAAEVITVTAPDAAVTISGTATVGQSNSKRFLVVITNVTGAAEAYTAYSLGTVVH